VSDKAAPGMLILTIVHKTTAPMEDDLAGHRGDLKHCALTDAVVWALN